MKRTNVYLDEEHIRILKHLAVDYGTTLTDLVRKAISEFIAREARPEYVVRSGEKWGADFEALLRRVRSRAEQVPPEEKEADISAARAEVRRSRRASGRR